MEALHLSIKNYWLPFCSRVTNGICPSVGFPSTQVCVLLCPTASYIKSTQFETYRRCLLLCVFVDSSRVKPVFIAIRTPRNPLPRHSATRYEGTGTCSQDEKSPGSGFQRARSGEIWPPCFHNETIHLLVPPDVRHDLYRTMHIVVGNEFAIWRSALVSTVLITFFQCQFRTLLNVMNQFISHINHCQTIQLSRTS